MPKGNNRDMGLDEMLIGPYTTIRFEVSKL